MVWSIEKCNTTGLTVVPHAVGWDSVVQAHGVIIVHDGVFGPA